MTIFDRLFHRHVYHLLKEVDNCQVHEVWHVCNCGRVLHQVIRDETQHTWLPYTYEVGTTTPTFQGVEIGDPKPCDIKVRRCSKCALKEVTKT
jgi:hypothetical protein